MRSRIHYYVWCWPKGKKDMSKNFYSRRSALRYFNTHPESQLDVRGSRDRISFKYCWKYWNKGRVVTQKFSKRHNRGL